MTDTGNSTTDQLVELAKQLISESSVKFVSESELPGLLDNGSIRGPVDTRDFTKIYPRTGKESMDNHALGFRAGRESRDDAEAYAVEHGYDVAYRTGRINVSMNETSGIVSISYEFYELNE